MNDYYGILGVSRDASQAEIKRAYRKLCVKLHPDVAGDTPDAEEKMKELNTAYDVLGDPDKRRQYDMGADPYATSGDSFGGFAASGFGDIFETLFNAAAGQARPSGPASRRQRGRDLVESLTLDLSEAVFGSRRDVTLSTFARCEVCDGSGCAEGTEPERCGVCHGQGTTTRLVRSLLGTMRTQTPCEACGGFGTTIPNPCQDCSGTGRVRTRRVVTVDLPAGVATGTRVRVAGGGEAGPGGGPTGDLYVDVRVRRHPDYVRDGDDLHCTIEVPMTAAALGATLTVQTLDGERELDVAPGTQHGEVLTLEGLGAGRLSGTGRGDLQVHLDVKVPHPTDEEERDLLRRLATLRGEERPEAKLAGTGGGMFSRLRDKLSGK